MNHPLDSHPSIATRRTTWEVAGIRVPRIALPVAAAFVGIHILALAVRLIGLGLEGLWQDEIHTVVTMQRPWLDLLTKPLSNAQPLYFALVKVWTGLFGLSETSIRLPSAIAGLLTVTMTFFLARRLTTNTWGPLCAALLVAVSPALIWYSQEARTYSLQGLFLVTGLFFLVDFLRAGRSRPLALYGLFAVLGLYTHFYSALYLAGIGLGGFAWLLSQRRGRHAGTFVIAHLLIAASLLPRVPIILHDLREIDVVGFTQPISHVMTDLVRFVGLAVPRLGGQASSLVIAAVWVAVLATAALSLARRSMVAVLVVTAVVSALLLAVGATFLGLPATIRYMVPVIPIYCVLAGLAIGEAVAWRPLARVNVAPVAALVASAAILVWGVFAWNNLRASPTKEDWRGVVHYIQDNSRQGDIVDVFPNRMARNVEFYLGAPANGLPAAQMRTVCQKQSRRVWLVVQSTARPADALVNVGQSCALVSSKDFFPYLTVFLLAPPAPGQQPAVADLACRGRKPTIMGTMGPDRITGTAGPDVIVALGGDDVVFAQDGDDTVCGGDGDDVIYGANGDDAIAGGAGADTLYGVGGNDQLDGDDGDDTLYGGEGNDRLSGGVGADELNAGPGNDTCVGDRTDETVGCESRSTAPPTLGQPFGP